MADPTPRHHELDGSSFEIRAGDLLLRLLQLRGWRISGSVNGSVSLEARLPLPRGEELAVSAVGGCTSEAVTSLFVKASEAQSRSRREHVAVLPGEPESVFQRAS